MGSTIFFSWQADTLTLTGRNFIERALERALERAVARISGDASIHEAVRDLAVDQGTQDVPGSPPVIETILGKIDAAAVVVSDLTFTGQRLDGRPTPNPNVLIEYGWALKSLTHSRIISVMNTAYGKPTADTLPFDLGYLRHPIQYNCPEDADDETRQIGRAHV